VTNVTAFCSPTAVVFALIPTTTTIFFFFFFAAAAARYLPLPTTERGEREDDASGSGNSCGADDDGRGGKRGGAMFDKMVSGVARVFFSSFSLLSFPSDVTSPLLKNADI
jgi:hypothetical protein